MRPLFVFLFVSFFQVAAADGFNLSPQQGVSELDPNEESDLIFDSALITGVGVWNAPALPRLILDERLERLDIENYAYTAEGNFLLIDTRLFFPFELESFSLGLTFNTTNWVAETPVFPFTLSAQKGRVRPSHMLGLNIGLRTDLIFAGMRAEAGLEMAASRTMYLGANLTSYAPLLRLRLVTDGLLSGLTISGMRPTIAGEVFTSPFLMSKGFDNRLATDSSGVVRNFSDFIELSPESSGYMYGFQVDFGFSWPSLDRGREHSMFLSWNFSSAQHQGVLTRTISDPVKSVEKIDADSTQNNFALSLRGAFR